MLASFQFEGTSQVFNDWLKINFRNGTIWSATSFRISVGTRLGSVALEASCFLSTMSSPFTIDLVWFVCSFSHVTVNDISVIYVATHRCEGGLKKKLDLRSGSHAWTFRRVL